jgi:acyl carrier protein
MSKQEFLDQLAELIEEPAGSLTGSEKLETLENWNSIALVGFMAMADEHFNIRISPRQFASCNDVDDLAKLVGL